MLLALIAVVVGVTLLLLTGMVSLAGRISPHFQAEFLPGVMEQIDTIWNSPWGLVIGFSMALGTTAFVLLRNRFREGRWLPWLMLGIIAVLLLTINGINVGISYIARNIDNTLVAYDQTGFWKTVSIYAFCLVIALPIRGAFSYLIPKLGLIWRRWLTGGMISTYMNDKAYYDLNPNDESQRDIDNPDQRISEDTRAFTSTSLSVTIEIIYSLLTFGSFIFVLWGISKNLTLGLLGYSVGGTLLIFFFSKKLVILNFEQLRLEADFRYGLVHIRDNAESIAFYRGEDQESGEANRRLDGAIRNYDKLIIWKALVDVVQRSYDYFSRFLPWLIIAPIYLAKDVDFGVFSQASIAFFQVLNAVSYIVNNIEELSRFSAGISRLETFQTSIEVLSRRNGKQAAFALPPVDGILVRNTELSTPDGTKLLSQPLSLSVQQGERLLVVGPSGCGKTSFLRMVSGLWQPIRGTVQRPPLGELLFIPQKPYMILGSLREQLCYPLDPMLFSDEQLRAVLEQVNLAGLIDRYPDLDIKQDWPRLLSLGEQQRLAFGRLLLNSPRYVVLDEATSALDVATEQRLYQLLMEREMAFISVGHRPTLAAFHTNVLEMDGKGDWALLPAKGYDFSRT